MTVSLWIPVLEAARLGIDNLVDIFSEAAESAGGELVDDSETMGDWEWFEFDGLSSEQIREFAARVVLNHKEINLTQEAPDGEDEPGDHVVVIV